MQTTSGSELDITPLEFKGRRSRANSVGPKYTCSIDGCDAVFKRLDQLDRHEFHHTGVKKHACSFEGCDKNYSIVTHLKRHIRNTHERKEPLQKTVKCSLPECGKLFTSEGNMQRHVREAHEAPREYACSHEGCSAKFRQKLKLRRHEIKEHTQAYPFRCAKCSRGFYQQWQQESHQRSCKLYACGTCDQQFDKWTLYTKHCRETLHSKNRHKCQQCEVSYDKPSDLNNHIVAKHPADKETSLAFPCPEPGCKRTYSYGRNLRQHMRIAHTGMRFECLATGCDRAFSSSQNLAKHIVRDHGKPKQPNATASPKQRPQAVGKLKRKRRHDAGKPVRSHLSKLSGLRLDKHLDREVRLRKNLSLKQLAKEIEVEIKEMKEQFRQAEDAVMQEILDEALKD